MIPSNVLASIQAHERARVRKALVEASEFKALAEYEALLRTLNPTDRAVAQALDTTSPAYIAELLDELHA